MNTSISLQEVLSVLEKPERLPWPLPVAHVTALCWLGGILKDKALIPRVCPVFQSPLLYLSYGGVFFRRANLQTQNAVELPIAFLFRSSILERITHCYPFDSGAMADRKFGHWFEDLKPFENTCRVELCNDITIPSLLVYHLYGDNARYLVGDPDPRCISKPEPIPTLARFASDDLSQSGVDHRQRSIELLTSKPIPIDDMLLWIGIPQEMTDEILGPLFDMTWPDVPDVHQYTYHRNFNPRDICAQLEAEAESLVKRYLMLFGKVKENA